MAGTKSRHKIGTFHRLPRFPSRSEMAYFPIEDCCPAQMNLGQTSHFTARCDQADSHQGCDHSQHRPDIIMRNSTIRQASIKA
jgi:hypothetical protein